MDSERGNFAKWSPCIPVLWLELIALFDDDFASERKISVEPSSPEAASIRHDVELIAVKLADLAPWCNFQAGAVSVTANDLESLNG